MLNNETVLKDAHRLLCILKANTGIFQMTPKTEYRYGGSRPSAEPLFRLHHQFLDDEFNHLLISLAICNRSHMDWRSSEHGREYPEKDCGVLRKSVNETEEVPLTFRESCNKIIHAERINFIYSDSQNVSVASWVQPIEETVVLFGTHFGKEWEARLEVLNFLRGTIVNFSF